MVQMIYLTIFCLFFGPTWILVSLFIVNILYIFRSFFMIALTSLLILSDDRQVMYIHKFIVGFIF